MDNFAFDPPNYFLVLQNIAFHQLRPISIFHLKLLLSKNYSKPFSGFYCHRNLQYKYIGYFLFAVLYSFQRKYLQQHFPSPHHSISHVLWNTKQIYYFQTDGFLYQIYLLSSRLYHNTVSNNNDNEML